MGKQVGMPPRERWGEAVPEVGTSCNNCEYLKDRKNMICGNPDFIAWEGPNKAAGSDKIPATDPRKYCSIWWENKDEDESQGLVQISGLEGNTMADQKFSHSVVTHHGDGTKTVHHIHKKHGHVHAVPEREGDVVGAVAGHDEMMDHMMDHTSEPNEGEDRDATGKPYPVPGPGAKA